MLPDSVFPHVSAAPGFRTRAEPADLPELMDGPCSYEEFRACLRDLAQVNRFTNAYKPTLQFLDRLVAQAPTTQPLHILDVGFGGGDMLRKVARWARKNGVAVHLTGVDLNPYSARAAREFSARDPLAVDIQWITGNVFSYIPTDKIDVVLSALFTHHLSSPDVVRFVEWMEQHARGGWFINDLQRSERAARWFRLLPVILRWHRFVRHDGPVSLRRAFRQDDWQRLLREAGIPPHEASIESHSMSRLCVARVR